MRMLILTCYGTWEVRNVGGQQVHLDIFNTHDLYRLSTQIKCRVILLCLSLYCFLFGFITPPGCLQLCPWLGLHPFLAFFVCAGVCIQVVRRNPGATERDGEHREADHPQPRDQHTRRFHAHQLALAQVRKHSHK